MLTVVQLWAFEVYLPGASRKTLNLHHIYIYICLQSVPGMYTEFGPMIKMLDPVLAASFHTDHCTCRDQMFTTSLHTLGIDIGVLRSLG